MREKNKNSMRFEISPLLGPKIASGSKGAKNISGGGGSLEP
jgi:hypothetical protein